MYSIYKSNGTLLLNLPDMTADTSASPLTLIGRGLLNFGKMEVENFIHILENFAGPAAPAHPLIGQHWYDTATSKMKIWNGSVWLRSMTGVDDGNVIPGVTIGSGLTINAGTITANVRSVAGRVGDVNLSVSDVAGSAPLLSPTLSGTPSSTTPAPGDTSTRIATTAYVRSQILADTLNYGAGNGLTVTAGNLAVVGSTNRITVSSNGVDIAATYAGQNSISTLGNVTAGQWSSTPVSVTYGGTGGTSPAEARANLQALQFNALADSLKSVANGFIVNNNGSAVPRTFVSGTPDRLSVSNGDGIGGNVTISLIGDTNSGPVLISGGGTGATTKTAAFNALSPASAYGDIIIYGSGGHERLQGRTDAGKKFFLTSGDGEAKPRWSSDLDAATLGGSNAAYFLSRTNHTGANNADTLGSKTPAFYLDRANHTGPVPSTAIVTSSTDITTLGNSGSGYVRFNGGFTIQWGNISGYWSNEFAYALTFPVAFTQIFSAVATPMSPSVFDRFHDWFWQIQQGTLTTTNVNVQLQQTAEFKGTAARGFYWVAYGYIA